MSKTIEVTELIPRDADQSLMLLLSGAHTRKLESLARDASYAELRSEGGQVLVDFE